MSIPGRQTSSDFEYYFNLTPVFFTKMQNAPRYRISEKIEYFFTPYCTSVLVQRLFVLTTYLPSLHVQLYGCLLEPVLFKMKTFYLIFRKSFKKGRHKKIILKRIGSKKNRLLRHVIQIIVFSIACRRT